ncbi:MAG TPA: hypothetical protein VHL57_07435, partial [Flavobacteriales bacterium]|nr:hypothetical protein [Flavobacteriales bacterium]
MLRQLDDNERGAFNYLFGGVVLVLVVRGVLFAVDRFSTPSLAEAASLDAFQHGYLLGRDRLEVVATEAGRMERVAFAVLASLGAAALVGAVAALCARMLGRTTMRAALGAGRIVFVLLLGWSIYAALFVPVRSACAEDGALVMRTYRMALRDIPVPFTAEAQQLTSADIALIEAVHTEPARGCDGQVLIHAVGPNGQATTLAHRAGLCADQQVEALKEASALAALF